MRVENAHKYDLEKLYETLGTSRRGLTQNEAQQRLQKYGPNEIKKLKGTPLWRRFLDNFTNLLAILLWVASALSFISGQPLTGWAIILVIVINAIFSFWQEFRAERATESLKNMLPLYAKVLRDGEERKVLASEVVPGDILFLEEGDHVPADARLIESFGLQVVNAALTGESEPVRRSSDTVKDDIPEIEAPNMVFMGTDVVSGTGVGIVCATGMDTEFGKIASLIQNIKEELSPLQKQINNVAQTIVYLSVGMGVFFFVFSISVGRPLADAFMFSIGIIAANVPEGLLPTVTLSLAVAVQRMAARHALVKKLSSVETLGSASVICTDKTGTLTKNEMTVKDIWSPEGHFNVTGVGYAPEGEFVRDDGTKLDEKAINDSLSLLLEIGVFSNNGKLIKPSEDNPNWTIAGDPTEASLLVVAEKAHISVDDLLTKNERVFVLPFDPARKRMTSINKYNGKLYAFTKGAPKETLSVCSYIQKDGHIDPLTQEDIDVIMEQNDKFAKDGLRVLAMAYREVPQKRSYEADEVEKDLIFVGLVGMMDPPRPEVADAVKLAKRAGIKIIMITGDYGLTAESIARKIGIVQSDKPVIVTGAELSAMDDEKLKEILKNEEVIFARCAPEDKLRIVSALKEMGQIVAVTGDGVNDTPALRKADIGIAMGKSGTDVAREVAEMVLTDDNFASIVAAVEEGRAIFDNIRKFITYIFSHLTAEAIPYILFSLFNIPLPLTVMQILAIDLGTETLPALALGTEPPEPGIMERPPRPASERLLNAGVFLRGYVLLGLIDSLGSLSGYFWVLTRGGWHWGQMLPINSPLAREAATMTFLGIVIMQVANAFACRTEVASMFKVSVMKNKLLLGGIAFELVFTALLIYVPFLQNIFGTYPVPITYWLFFLPFTPLLIGAEELRKYVYRRKLNRKYATD
jgi:potassium/sodium efflux P-type ATPase